MPRKARIDAPGALHHIIIRGIERKSIFKNDQDYHNFLNRLGKILIDTSTSCFAWALMKNHVHLLLRTGLCPISTVMRRLLTWYSQQFNRRHKRHGHLFQNRYKSFLCEEDPYLLELVRYIHLNPLRAGVVSDIKELNEYKRCGHAVIMGKVKQEWQDTDYVLGYFNKKAGIARSKYTEYVKKGISIGRRPDLVGGGLVRSFGGWSALKEIREANTRVISDERILGSSEFAESVLKKANEVYERKTKLLAGGIKLDQVIEIVAEYLELDIDQIKKRGRKRSIAIARSVICALAVDRLMMSGSDISRSLNITPSAISKLISRGREDNLFQKVEAKMMELYGHVMV